MFDKFIPNEIREALDKAVPNELKGILGTAAATYVGGLVPGGMLGGGAGSFFTDLLMQSLLNDDDSGQDTDYLKAGMSGLFGGLQNIESGFLGGKDPVTRTVNLDKAGIMDNPKFGTEALSESDYITQMKSAGYENISPSDFADYQSTFANQNQFLPDPSVATNTDLLSRLNEGTAVAGDTGNYFQSDFKKGVSDFFTPFDYTGGEGFKDALGETTSSLTMAELGNAPSQVRDARDALKAAETEYANYIAGLDERSRASLEADNNARIAAYKEYMGLAGYSEEEIDDALRLAGYIGEGQTAYAADGGRIGFADGSGDGIAGLSLNYNRFYDDYPEAQVGTYINENRYKSEKIEKLEQKVNDFKNMRLDKRKGEYIPEKGMLEKVVDQEISNLYMERENDNLRISEKQKRERKRLEQMLEALEMQKQFHERYSKGIPTAMQRDSMEAERLAEQLAQKEAMEAAKEYRMNRTGRAMGGMMNSRMGFAMGSQDRPNMNYGSGRMTPGGDPIAPNVPPGKQMDLRPGGFIELGTEPRADDVPAMVGKDEFVLNDRAVSGIGKVLTGKADARAGARALYDLQNQMEAIV